ncbi:alpha/beta fold hydrolase [Streptomyces sp. NPDC000880]
MHVIGERVDADGARIWVERRDRGPDVLLIAGLSDPAEAWQPQLDGPSDRYRLIAFDSRGGRDARHCLSGRYRYPWWLTTPRPCCGRSK